MLGRIARLLGAGLLTSSVAAGAPNDGLRDLFFGEGLYYAWQGEHFDAIARLDAELGQYYALDDPSLDPFHFHAGQAQFSVGDFELAYRMHRRAGRAVEAVLHGSVAAPVRNEAAFRLARIYFQKGQPVNALHALERISGEVPERIRTDLAFLRAQIYLANGRFADAVAVLDPLQGAPGYAGFAEYNYGIALLRDGKEAAGLRALDRAGQVRGDEPGTFAIKDKANLVLGSQLLDLQRFDEAKRYLDRVRLEGPFSNKALLGLGWADASAERYERALVPWSILAKRNVTDQFVQEALLAVPYAYGKLGIYGKAALGYGQALEAVAREIDKLGRSIVSIREGAFLHALVREEIKHDINWMIKLRALPDAPETYYLMELMASHDFQESLKNYLDLDALRKRLADWDQSLDAWQELIGLRRAYYEPLLPEIDSQFRRLDARMRLRMEQRDRLEERLQALLIAARPEHLATAEERMLLEEIAELEKALQNGPVSERTRQRIRRLKGVIHWRIHTEYDARLTEAHKHLRELDSIVANLRKRYASFVRTRQAATQSYEGYADTLSRQKNAVRLAHDKVRTLMARQGHLLESMAVSELERRRTRLDEFQVKARFAMADSYDRATRAQADREVQAARDAALERPETDGQTPPSAPNTEPGTATPGEAVAP